MTRSKPSLLTFRSHESFPHRPKRRHSRPLRALEATWTRCVTTVSGRIIAGMALGQAAVVAIDWLVGGPGPFVVFGL